ncbi:MAG: sensor domain-containing diguanylate cyclase [Planctomycetota bacterium]
MLDTPPEERFDRITRLACRLFDVPMALVSLVDAERQWFKSAQGVEARETPRTNSFCDLAIRAEETLVVPNAARDTRFKDHPVVSGEPQVRFYAGHPLHSADGHRVGTLCVIDTRPRRLSASDLDSLRDLAAMVEVELRADRLRTTQRYLVEELENAQRKAQVDSLTGVWNRGAIEDRLGVELSKAERDGSAIGVLMIDLDHFKSINDNHGHPAGDAVLREVAQRLQNSVRAYDCVGRWGGEEFVVVLSGAGPMEAASVGESIRARIAVTPIQLPGGGELSVTTSVGATGVRDGVTAPAEELIDAADRAVYAAKEMGRDRVCVRGVSKGARADWLRPRPRRVKRSTGGTAGHRVQKR